MKNWSSIFFCFLLCCANAVAQQSQIAAVSSVLADGLGPQYFDVAPNRSFFSIYGTVDLGLNYTNAGGTSVSRMESGSGWTSKLGFYGQEDLGRGWITFFRLESGLNSNAGALQNSSSMFNRASFIGLKHRDYGQLTLGRQFTSVGAAAIGSDVFLANGHESIYAYLLTASDLRGLGNNAIGDRLNQTVRYITPAIARYFSADLSVSFKQDRTNGPSLHAHSASLSYSDGKTSAGLGYAQAWCDPAVAGECANSLPSTQSIRTGTYIASLMHDFGYFIGNLAYIKLTPKGPGAATASAYSLGLAKMVDVNFYRASVVYRNTSINKNYAYGATAGVDHYLSKRTALYVRAGLLKNGPQSRLLYNYDSTSGNVVPSVGGTVRDITVGMFHHF